jgi:hypothetical protein
LIPRGRGVGSYKEAINIGGNNCFKPRDIGRAFDFGANPDGARNTGVIDVGKRCTPE